MPQPPADPALPPPSAADNNGRGGDDDGSYKTFCMPLAKALECLDSSDPAQQQQACLVRRRLRQLARLHDEIRRRAHKLTSECMLYEMDVAEMAQPLLEVDPQDAFRLARKAVMCDPQPAGRCSAHKYPLLTRSLQMHCQDDC